MRAVYFIVVVLQLKPSNIQELSRFSSFRHLYVYFEEARIVFVFVHVLSVESTSQNYILVIFEISAVTQLE